MPKTKGIGQPLLLILPGLPKSKVAGEAEKSELEFPSSLSVILGSVVDSGESSSSS